MKRFALAACLSLAALAALAAPLEYSPTGAVDLSRIIEALDPAPPREPIALSGATPKATTSESATPEATMSEAATSEAEPVETEASEPRFLILHPVFSALDALPMTAPGYAGTARLVEAPVLAGGRRASGARGLESSGAAPYESQGPRRVSETVLFGGLAESVLFGGLRFSLAGEFGEEGSVLPFGRVDAALEYDKYLGEDYSEKRISLGLAGGVAGKAPIPWILAGRVLLKDAAPEGGRGLLLLEAGDELLRLGGLGTLRANAGFGLEIRASDTDFLRDDLLVRARLELEGRTWRGALARGLAAYAAAEARYDLLERAYRDEYRLGVEGAARFGSFAGLTGSLAFVSGTETLADWASALRGVSDLHSPIAGTQGATLKAELPFLFARGLLFQTPRLAVEFFLKPFLDAALVRPSGGAALFDAANLYAAVGGELAMTIDRDRRQALRVSCGVDLSRAIRGEGNALSSGDLELAAVFAFAR